MADPRPVAVYGLEVPCGDMMIQGNPEEFAPGKYRITMAAIDPTAEPVEADAPRRATLKMVRIPYPLDEEDSDDEEGEEIDDDDVEAIEARLAMLDSEDEDSEAEANGGPGEKTKKARAAALKKALEEAEEDEEEDGMELELANGTSKGKARASDDDDDEELDDFEIDSDDEEIEEFTVCTLDTERVYQQAIDITIDTREQIFFKVTGGYNVYLTGNYLASIEELEDDYDDSEDEDEDGLEALADLEGLSDEDFSEEDELDDIENPRITEIEEEAPKLVKAKNSKKRAADDAEADGPEDVLKTILKEDATTNGEKLTKSQKKKLKNNAGKATDAPEAEKKDAPAKDAKKVQFAEKLIQGQSAKSEPKSNGKTDAKAGAKDEKKTWTVNGVTIDERKVGSGSKAKAGNKLGMRYIGKLKDGKVFDSNTKGEPFKFKLGKGEVIKGWDIGIAGMAVGGERRIVIPAHLAYGKQKTGGIPANSELTFDIKLLSLN